ncbi:MAG: SMC-Scp complex subunit ScpB [Candidatus Omnitrophica bacterium]|nr:SMC-Scp complex subunit ScpB [Candidatus Omnitrophota bacterium]
MEEQPLADQAAVKPPAPEVDGQMTHIKGVIESILFVNEQPVALEQLKKVFPAVGMGDIKKALGLLQEEYQTRKSGMVIMEIAGGFQMLTNSIYAESVRAFYKTKHKEKLSKPSLETVAIVAYKQPVTRADIEIIRGVNSDGVVEHLLNKELIKIIGRKDVAGKPYLYGTTKQFLEYFGLKSLEDLPKLEEFPGLISDKETALEEHNAGEGSQAEPGHQSEQESPTEDVEK